MQNILISLVAGILETTCATHDNLYLPMILSLMFI